MNLLNLEIAENHDCTLNCYFGEFSSSSINIYFPVSVEISLFSVVFLSLGYCFNYFLFHSFSISFTKFIFFFYACLSAFCDQIMKFLISKWLLLLSATIRSKVAFHMMLWLAILVITQLFVSLILTGCPYY